GTWLDRGRPGRRDGDRRARQRRGEGRRGGPCLRSGTRRPRPGHRPREKLSGHKKLVSGNVVLTTFPLTSGVWVSELVGALGHGRLLVRGLVGVEDTLAGGLVQLLGGLALQLDGLVLVAGLGGLAELANRG